MAPAPRSFRLFLARVDIDPKVNPLRFLDTPGNSSRIDTSLVKPFRVTREPPSAAVSRFQNRDRQGVGLSVIRAAHPGSFHSTHRWHNQGTRMQRSGCSFEMARSFGLAFPDLEEGTMYGSPAIKLGKRLIACIPSHRSAEPGSLAIRTDFDQREGFLADDPATYYVTDHYVNHPIVLVRLARIQPDQLRELIAAARRLVIEGAKAKTTAAPRRRMGRAPGS